MTAAELQAATQAAHRKLRDIGGILAAAAKARAWLEAADDTDPAVGRACLLIVEAVAPHPLPQILTEDWDLTASRCTLEAARATLRMSGPPRLVAVEHQLPNRPVTTDLGGLAVYAAATLRSHQTRNGRLRGIAVVSASHSRVGGLIELGEAGDLDEATLRTAAALWSEAGDGDVLDAPSDAIAAARRLR